MQNMITPTCINNGCTRNVTYSHSHKDGTKRWRPVCWKCHLASYGAQPLEEGITEAKKTYCENVDERLGYKCTAFIPYKGALEIDHIDGNAENNTIENIQTLCRAVSYTHLTLPTIYSV